MTFSPSRAVLVARTVRHLRPSQIGWRLWYRVRPRPAPSLAAPPARRAVTGWVVPVEKPASFRADDHGGGRFEFLGVERTYAGDIDWDDPKPEKLWRYNLHYFDWLGSAAILRDPAAGWAQVERWIASNPPGEGEGWEPYPLSLRVVNWMKLALASGELPERARASLAVQLRWLERHRERHIRANHLFENVRALAFAGLFFGGDEGARWLRAGASEMERELAEQILADGAHYERSPMYQATLLEGLLDLVNLGRARAPDPAEGASAAALATALESWESAARAMQGWLDRMTHPDGEISFFNDAAFGIAARPGALADYAVRLGLEPHRDGDATEAPLGAPGAPGAPGAHDLAPSGYARLENGRTVLLVDIAPVGPDHQPGHAHADTLSFELSHAGRRVLVNVGTSTYREGTERSYERATRAHNTVEVGGRDSSEVWATFRVARRARVIERSVGVRDGELVAAGAHDGYRRLSPPVVHRREWRLDGARLLVTDVLDGDGHASVARFLVHPDLVALDDGRIVDGPVAEPGGGSVAPDETRHRWEVDGGSARVVAAHWSPGFGRRVSCTCIELTRGRGASHFTLRFGSG